VVLQQNSKERLIKTCQVNRTFFYFGLALYKCQRDLFNKGKLWSAKCLEDDPEAVKVSKREVKRFFLFCIVTTNSLSINHIMKLGQILLQLAAIKHRSKGSLRRAILVIMQSN
jgi:hypothetical protein